MYANKWAVGTLGDQIVIGLPTRACRMSKEDALVLAAWLVAIASEDPEKDFQPILKAICKT